MAEAIALAAKLSSVGFPTLLILILIGNYYEVWVWGRQLRKAEATSDKWQDMALRSVGIAETTVNIAKSKGSA